MKVKRKGFTLVELLVVIAILAVLATVAILGYSAFTKKATISNDIAIVKQMNVALLADETSGKNINTVQDAVDTARMAGFIYGNLTPTTVGYDIKFDMTSKRFYLFGDGKIIFKDDKTSNDVESHADRIIRVVHAAAEKNLTTKQNPLTEGVYLYIDADNGEKADISWESTVYISKSFDAGNVECLKEVYYINLSEKAQTALVRTNTFGTKVVAEGYVNPADNKDGDVVIHYGFAGIVYVKKVAMASYDENGVVGRLEAEEGHVDIKEDAVVHQVQQTGTDSNNNVVSSVSVQNGATVYDVDGNKVTEEISETSTKFTAQNTEEENKDETLTAAQCSHEHTTLVSDDVEDYELCKNCGYSLITVRYVETNSNDEEEVVEVKKTVAESGENKIVPINTYAATSVITGKDANGEVTINANATPMTTQEQKQQDDEVKNNNEKKEETKNTCTHEWILITDTATCTTDGTKTFQCENCKEYKYVGSSKGHIWDATTHQCTRSGAQSYTTTNTDGTIYYCVCGNVLSVWHTGNLTKEIDFNANAKASSVSELIIQDGVVDIKKGVFTKMTNIKKVTIPKTCVNLYGSAFNPDVLETLVVKGNASAINGTVIPDTGDWNGSSGPYWVPSDTSIWKGVANTIGHATENNGFVLFTKLKTVRFEGKASLGIWAFAGCTSLTSLDLSGVIKMKDVVFQNCTALEKVFLTNTITVSSENNCYQGGSWMFDGCYSLKDVYIETPLGEESLNAGLYNYNWTGSCRRQYSFSESRIPDDTWSYTWTINNYDKLRVHWGCTYLGDNGTQTVERTVN